MSKMRIMMAVSTTRGGGAEIHCTRVVEYLAAKSECEVSMLCFTPSPLWTPPENVKMYYVGGRKDASLFSRFMRIREAIKDFNPDIINAWNPEVMSLPCAFWGRLMGKIVLTSRMSAHKSIFKGGIFREYLNLFADLLGNGIISNAPVNMADSWLFKTVFEMRKHTIIPNGIEPYSPQGTDLPFLETLKSDKNFKIIFVGRFVGLKRIDTILAAFFNLKKEGAEVSLYLCGGKMKDLAYCSDILEQNKEYLNDVHCLGFQTNWRDIGVHCDAYVLASSTEGLSNSLLEAMSIGLPILVSDISGNRFVCREGREALFFKVGDSDGLADDIRLLMSNAQKRESLSKNATEKSKEYPISKMCESYMDFYREHLK